LPLAALLLGGGIAVAIILLKPGDGASDVAAAEVERAPARPSPSEPVTTPAIAAPQPAPDPRPAAAAQVAPTAPAPSLPPPAPEPIVEAPQHGTVSIATTPEGAEVLRNGAVIGTTPMQLVLPAGEHTLELRRSDFAPSVVPIDIVAGKQVTLDLALQPTARAEVAPPPPPATSPGRAYPRTRKPARGDGAPSGEAAEVTTPKVTAPATTILGRDKPRQPVSVLGRDIVQEQPNVKILGSEVSPPEPKVKVLGP
jgi:hypothetical protein